MSFECEDCQEYEDKLDKYPKIETMNDERKLEFLATVFDKFTLEQLEERLTLNPIKIKPANILEMLNELNRYDMFIVGQSGAGNIEADQYTHGEWIKSDDIDEIIEKIK